MCYLPMTIIFNETPRLRSNRIETSLASIYGFSVESSLMGDGGGSTESISHNQAHISPNQNEPISFANLIWEMKNR